MSFFQQLLWQYIAHLLVDFWFQSERMCADKLQKAFCSRSLALHLLIVFLMSWLFSFAWNFGLFALFIALSHWSIDGLKALVNRKQAKTIPYTFIIDQFIHLLLIGLAVLFYFNTVSNISFPVPLSINVLMIILGYILCTKPANVGSS